MSLLTNMTDKTLPRGFRWIWFIRLLQLVIALLVLILAAVDIQSVRNLYDGCGTPSRIAFNLACAVLAIVVLVYLIFATGPTNLFKALPWLVWGQLALDAVMWVFWLAASSTSNLTVNEVCNACPISAFELDDVEYACPGYYLDRFGNVYYPRDVSPARGLEGVVKRATALRRRKSGSHLGRQALDAIMTVLFAITFMATVWWIYTQRRSSSSAAPTTKPPGHEEAGVPMTSTQPSAPTAVNPQTQSAQYYGAQGQPQQHPQQPQNVYQQSAPPVQYPPQPQQFTPQQQVVYQQQ